MPRTPSLKKKKQADDAVVIYARVSSDRQFEEGFSIDAQLTLLRDYCAKKGLIVAEEFIEIESASRAGRPLFDRMCSLAKRGKINGIVVEKTDRLLRNAEDGVTIDKLGVSVHLVKEHAIITQESMPNERLGHGIQRLLAQYYTHNLQLETKKGMLAKAQLGQYPSQAPVGYQNITVGSSKTIEQDPEIGPIVKAMFERYAEGNISVADVAEFGRSMGLKTRHGGRISKGTVHVMLSNIFYIGKFKWNGTEYVGQHKPLVSLATFNAVQVALGSRGSFTQPTTKKEFAYRGIFRCGQCGCLMSPSHVKKKGITYYSCTGARGCTRRGGVREEVITEQIAALLNGLAIRSELVPAVRACIAQNFETVEQSHSDSVEFLTRRKTKIMTNLKQLYINQTKGLVTELVAKELNEEWMLDLRAVEEKLERAQTAKVRTWQDAAALIEILSNLGNRFKMGNSEQKQVIAKSALSNPTIKDGKLSIPLNFEFNLLWEANNQTALETGSEKLGAGTGFEPMTSGL